MAYPASEGVRIDAIRRLDLNADRTKQFAQSLRDDSAAGDTDRQRYRDLLEKLTSQIDQIQVATTIAGIGPAINAEKPVFAGTGGNAATEALAMRDAAIVLRDWLHTTLQDKNLSGNPALDGTLDVAVFTTAQTATFRTNADAYIATIG